MKQPHSLPRRNWLGVGLSLLVVIAAALGIAWNVIQLITEAGTDPPTANASAAAPVGE